MRNQTFFILVFSAIFVQFPGCHTLSKREEWEKDQRERIADDLKLVQNGKEKDAVINWLVAERWDHKKTNDEKIAAEKDKMKYAKAVAVLFSRSTLEKFKQVYLCPIARPYRLDMESANGIEDALYLFFDPRHEKWGRIRAMYSKLVDHLNSLGLDYNFFIEQNMYAYREFSKYDHMFREHCVRTDFEDPLSVPLSRQDCLAILEIVPFVDPRFKGLLKDINNELYFHESRYN